MENVSTAFYVQCWTSEKFLHALVETLAHTVSDFEMTTAVRLDDFKKIGGFHPVCELCELTGTKCNVLTAGLTGDSLMAEDIINIQYFVYLLGFTAWTMSTVGLYPIYFFPHCPNTATKLQACQHLSHLSV